jgi:hypothetical protein
MAQNLQDFYRFLATIDNDIFIALDKFYTCLINVSDLHKISIEFVFTIYSKKKNLKFTLTLLDDFIRGSFEKLIRDVKISEIKKDMARVYIFKSLNKYNLPGFLLKLKNLARQKKLDTYLNDLFDDNLQEFGDTMFKGYTDGKIDNSEYYDIHLESKGIQRLLIYKVFLLKVKELDKKKRLTLYKTLFKFDLEKEKQQYQMFEIRERLYLAYISFINNLSESTIKIFVDTTLNHDIQGDKFIMVFKNFETLNKTNFEDIYSYFYDKKYHNDGTPNKYSFNEFVSEFNKSNVNSKILDELQEGYGYPLLTLLMDYYEYRYICEFINEIAHKEKKLVKVLLNVDNNTEHPILKCFDEFGLDNVCNFIKVYYNRNFKLLRDIEYTSIYPTLFDYITKVKEKKVAFKKLIKVYKITNKELGVDVSTI